MKIEIKGALAANISWYLHVRASVISKRQDGSNMILKGIVSGPVRPFFSSPKTISGSTEDVRLTVIQQFKQEGDGPQTPVESEYDHWAVPTSKVTITL